MTWGKSCPLGLSERAEHILLVSAAKQVMGEVPRGGERYG